MAKTPEGNGSNASNDNTEATGWRPSAGDVLTGTVVSIDKGWSDYTDSYYPIVGVREDDGSIVSVHCFHAILQQRMLDLAPEIGTPIEITCQGEKKTKDGKRSFVAYTVTIPGETGARTWAQLGAQPTKAARSAAPVGSEQAVQEALDDIPF